STTSLLLTSFSMNCSMAMKSLAFRTARPALESFQLYVAQHQRDPKTPAPTDGAVLGRHSRHEGSELRAAPGSRLAQSGFPYCSGVPVCRASACSLPPISVLSAS